MTDEENVVDEEVNDEEKFFRHYIEYIDNRLHRYFTKLTIAFSLLGISVAIAFIYTAQVSNQNKRALCAVKRDAEERIAQSEEFLIDHPNGVPGISALVLRRGLDNAKRTAGALKDVTCA